MAIRQAEPFYMPQAPPRRPVSRAPRWLRPALLATPAVAVVGWVVAHDPGPGLDLSPRGWVTLAGAAVLAVLVARDRRRGRLARDVLVAAVAVLLVTASAQPSHSPAAPPPATAQIRAAGGAPALGEGCPAVAKVRAWVKCLVDQTNAAAEKQGGTP